MTSILRHLLWNLAMSSVNRLRRAAPLWFVVAVMGCGGATQLGGDEEAFAGVDALYTAVTTRRPDLLEKCKQHLNALEHEGKLPAPALADLQPIIAQAEQGQWRPAAERLYVFMRGQRKDR